ncbi:hypothetical protein GCM10010123_03910 [Pilimelia anulata]|uniref:histidine kinase n=1 Tax=Pilimelia anulata TaxID=53371 RepID=A0A8J3B3S3_9ACTN|nr:hypothetical protein [Pilimelia anulata]GGJ77141.1 hypothetical protein GCM10010123_03910 [Pilimelia anulata]
MDDEAARELDRLRREIGHTAHELANVLGIVQNYVAFLAEDLPADPDSPARKDLPPLESATERAIALVQQLQHTVAGVP